MSAKLRVAVVGFGYWGPNLVRNFLASPRTTVAAIVDGSPDRRERAAGLYPQIPTFADVAAVLERADVDAVAIATPIFTHFKLADAALRAGKHVLVEKPLTASVAEAEQLAELADRSKRVLMADHTFVYTSAVRKIRDLIAAGELGQLLYFDSVRINLGLFQPDLNVIWDLAPHDLTIMDYVLAPAKPRWISAIGASHYRPQENLAYVTVGFDDGLLAHVHVNWIAPVKTRRTIIAGREKMVVWDDTSPVEPVKIYASSVDVKQPLDKESQYALNVQYRSGDVVSPKLDGREALAVMAGVFADACLDGKPSPSDARAAVNIVRMLAAAQTSLEREGQRVSL